MRCAIPSLSLVVTSLAITDGKIVALDVENGAWSFYQLDAETRTRLNDAFSADNRVYAVPRDLKGADYNDVFAWFDEATEDDKRALLQNNAEHGLRVDENEVDDEQCPF